MSDAARYMEYAITCANLVNGEKDVEKALQLLQAWKGLALQTLPSRYPDVVGAPTEMVGASPTHPERLSRCMAARQKVRK